MGPSFKGATMSNERIFIDCEFNGFGGELISMALVAEYGGEWYCVLPEPRVWDEWCFENVFPVLGTPAPTLYATSRAAFRASLANWLSQFDNPTIVADWYTDLFHFFDSYRGNDHTESIVFPCRAELVNDVPDFAPAVPHNALSDARGIRDALTAGRAALSRSERTE